MMDLLRGLVGTLTFFYAFCLAAAQGSADIGPNLQGQFCVGKLPNVTWTIGRQYAGNLPVQRGTNLSLFFWGVESKQGSLTAPAGKNNAPWNIWLQGYVARSVLINPLYVVPVQLDVLLVYSGPGSSSLFGLLHEVCHGPIPTPLRI